MAYSNPGRVWVTKDKKSIKYENSRANGRLSIDRVPDSDLELLPAFLSLINGSSLFALLAGDYGADEPFL
ncbi:hypothetical protein NP590_16890 [Methylomonas sp. SURF-2]|uniref:Uncharacterized protein n=1 Tax=Methylomonas subterranea TaxID=2952225 RepID=A0ABT1TK09_9GAMM|nr:hypothetical protein [Methylomonas sp. SURF-2]MCQ8105788.1 hypothetical protein [Methylomonas sp. SURF-2]